MGKFISILLLLITSNLALGHGNHGGNGGVSIEDDMANGNHLHLPVRIEPSGEILFGFEDPFKNTEHEGEHEEEGKEGHNHSKYHIAPTLIVGGDYVKRLISKDIYKDTNAFES